MSAHTVHFAGSFDSLAALPADGLPEVVFAGRSNVGKSSLVNMLLGRRAIARTSSQPGKTRTLNYYLVDGDRYFVDLPGLGYAKVARSQRQRWGRLIRDYLTQRDALRLIVQLVDARHGLTRTDDDLLAEVVRSDAPALIVLTKCDKMSSAAVSKQVAGMTSDLRSRGLEVPVVATSAKKSTGGEELWEWIRDIA
jgi:GTP-binding protein